MSNYSKEQIEKASKEIENMGHEEMCHIWRFAPQGSEIYFQGALFPEGKDFKTRLYDHFGGFTPEISKRIGWK